MFAVRTTDDRFLELLHEYLGDHRVADGLRDQAVYCYSADFRPDRQLAGRKVARGVHSLYLQTLRIFRGREQEAMAGSLISSMRELATSVQNEFVRIRAGSVELNGGALVMPSPPEGHLPALVALLVRGGAPYLGDEMLRLDPVLRRVHGLPLPLLLDARDLPLFGDIRRTWPTSGDGSQRRGTAPLRHPVSVRELGASSSEPVPVRWIVFPRFDPGSAARFEPIGRSEALFCFARAGLNLHVWRARALTLMHELLESVPVSRLVVGSLPHAADLLLNAGPRAIAR